MMKKNPEEKNAFDNNPKSKLTSADSGSDHSSCDAKKVKVVKLQPVMILMIQVLILTLRVKMPILALKILVPLTIQML
jgi:hypothetical protein